MCSPRIISRTQRQSKLQTVKKTNAKEMVTSKDHCECDHLTSRVSTAGGVSHANIDITNKRLSNLPNKFICLTLPDFVPLTVITMLYIVILLPALGLVEAAPTPWSNACGIYTSADEQLSYEPLRGAAKNRVLCELRGNLTKQINSLRRHMGPKNFSKVWSKHNKSYAFLKVARAKNITLRTWHKQLQAYVAAADHLYERANSYKQLQQTAWVTSHEQINRAEEGLKRLRHLIITTRGIICELEVTANLLTKPRMQNKALAIDGAVIEEHLLQLRSDKRSAEEGVDTIDINMIYQRLRRSLLNMRKALKRRCRKRSPGAKQQQKQRAGEEEMRQHVVQGEEVRRQHKQSKKHGQEDASANQRHKSHKPKNQREHRTKHSHKHILEHI